jgi:hypothetical protein
VFLRVQGNSIYMKVGHVTNLTPFQQSVAEGRGASLHCHPKVMTVATSGFTANEIRMF